jgi:hypothetical protein
VHPNGVGRGTTSSLVWLETEGDLNKGVELQETPIGSGFKKGCVILYYSTLLLNYRLLGRGRSWRDVLYRPCHLGVSFLRVCCFALGNSIC